MYSPLKKIKGKKKRQLCDVIEILTNAIVVIIFKHISVSNQHTVHLKCINFIWQLYLNKVGGKGNRRDFLITTRGRAGHILCKGIWGTWMLGFNRKWGQKEGERVKTVGRTKQKKRIIVLWLLRKGYQMPASNLRDLMSKGHRYTWEKWDQNSEWVSS